MCYKYIAQRIIKKNRIVTILTVNVNVTIDIFFSTTLMQLFVKF